MSDNRSMMESTTTNDRQRHTLRRDLIEEEKEDSSPPQTEEQQQPILEEGTKVEDILLSPPKTPPNTQPKEIEIQKDNATMTSADNLTENSTDNKTTSIEISPRPPANANVTMASAENPTANSTDNKTSIEIPPRPPTNANSTSSAEAQSLENSHLVVIFPTMTPIAKKPSSSETKDDNNNKEPVSKGPPHPVTNATLTDLAHQEIENWFGDGPDLSWTDEDDDKLGSKETTKNNDEPSEMQQQEESNDEVNPTPTNKVTTTPSPTPVMTLKPLEPVAAPVVIEPTSILPPSSKTMVPDVVVSPTPSPIVTKKTNVPTRTKPPPRTLVPTMAPTTPVELCHSLGMHTVAHFSCETGFPSIMVYGFFAFFPLLLICCCWKYCCSGNSKGRDVQGEYRAVANTYGDANFDNAFSDNFSDDEDEDFGFISSNRNNNNSNNGDVEESWGKSGGKRVLEMSNLGTKDDLSLEEMNG